MSVVRVIYYLMICLSSFVFVAQELKLTYNEITVYYHDTLPIEAAEMIALRAEKGFKIIRTYLAQVGS